LTVLATGVIPATSAGSIAAFVPVTFASPPPPVTAGTQYTIVAYSATSGNAYGWHLRMADVYAGGASFFTGDSPPTAST
jgi:hypothetical protein